jgi:diguanylate cyclase (GGDEF)-like protein/PAS domain S-box-containing protein
MVIGGNRSVIGLILDVTDRKRSEERLRQQAMVFNITQEGVVITDPQCRVIDVNPAFERITEYSRDEIRGEHIRFIQSGRHDRSFYMNMWQSLLGVGSWQGEIWNRRKGGDIYLDWIGISAVRDEAGNIVNYVGTSIDISRMKHAQSEIERLAYHDGLTDLPNRLLLISRLQQAIERGTRYRSMGAVLFIDLDHFKPINDKFGHMAGDELLRQVANRLTGRLRGTDIVARLGGDEFVIVLEQITCPDAAAMVAREVIGQLQTPFALSCGTEVQIGASVGIALFPQDGVTPTQLIGRADQALYVGKRGGRGICRFFGEP